MEEDYSKLEVLTFAGSVPRYTDILVKLTESADAATEAIASRAGPTGYEIAEFREAVVSEFMAMTTRFIESLPDSVEYGAAVTLREYAHRNRDDIVRRIRLGRHRGVEETFTRISLR